MLQDCDLNGKQFFVMGEGKFGTHALRYLKAKGAKVLVVDVNLGCNANSEVDVQTTEFSVLDSLDEWKAAFLEGDAVDLLEALLETKLPDMVVTAIPGNVVAKVVEGWLMKRGIKLEPYLEVIPKVLENIPESLVSFVDYV